MALALAVFGLTAVGAIVAGTLMSGVLENQSGRNTLYLMQAAAAGEGELPRILDSLDTGTLLALPIGAAPLELGVALPAARLAVKRQVSRLQENLFLIRVRAVRTDAGGGTLASRAAGLFVRVVRDSLTAEDVLAPVSRGWLQLH